MGRVGIVSVIAPFLAGVLVAAHALGAADGNPGGPNLGGAYQEAASWSSWFGGRGHLGTGKVLVRVDRSRLAKGTLFLDDVDLKYSPTGIIVRQPGVIALRSAVPGIFHDWYPAVYCEIVVHPDEITVVDVQLRVERDAEGTFVSRPVCKCLIQEVKDTPSDGKDAPTCE